MYVQYSFIYLSSSLALTHIPVSVAELRAH